MLIFHKHSLYVCGWVRSHKSNTRSLVVSDTPAVIKDRDIIYVSDHSVSDIQYHLANKMKRNYQPTCAIYEIHPNGSAMGYIPVDDSKRRDSDYHITMFDTGELFVVGYGSRAFVASLELCDGDVLKALKNTREITAALKEGATIAHYALPVPKVTMLEPTNIFKLE